MPPPENWDGVTWHSQWHHVPPLLPPPLLADVSSGAISRAVVLWMMHAQIFISSSSSLSRPTAKSDLAYWHTWSIFWSENRPSGCSKRPKMVRSRIRSGIDKAEGSKIHYSRCINPCWRVFRFGTAAAELDDSSVGDSGGSKSFHSPGISILDLFFFKKNIFSILF